jgi:hypothetical protein
MPTTTTSEIPYISGEIRARVGSAGYREVVSGAQSGGRAGVGDGVRGNEIYVDATDLDGEMLVVKKKKSRAGLDAIGWGATAPGPAPSPPSASTAGGGRSCTESPLRIGKEKSEKCTFPSPFIPSYLLTVSRSTV